ncbi:CGNR zinc finger domain-containing protein [Streptodolium elevatio]|uniref:CGNR zinc finger domain-containing protein n=1 Tax=Streptodolium elevatio TaxID=3157996 RepID=A0ABV3DE25_9ACTN
MDKRPLTGEPVALDLVNTRWPEHGVLRDHLAEPGHVGGWLAEHGLAAAPTAEEAGGSEAVGAALIVVREAIRAALEQADFGPVSAVLDRGRLRLGIDRDGPVEHVEVDEPAWYAAWQIARAYTELVRTADPARIRRCANPECTLWFHDVSRNGRRRWCSMTGCGNRAKARAHYARR